MPRVFNSYKPAPIIAGVTYTELGTTMVLYAGAVSDGFVQHRLEYVHALHFSEGSAFVTLGVFNSAGVIQEESFTVNQAAPGLITVLEMPLVIPDGGYVKLDASTTMAISIMYSLWAE